MKTDDSDVVIIKDNFYELLGVSQDSSEDQILYEYRLKAREFHPDKNTELNTTLSFQKIQKAKEILTDRHLRQLYDMWLSSGMNIPFKEYLRLQKKFQECMHWHSDTSEGSRMLLGASNIGDGFMNKADPNKVCDILRLFRTYEI